MKKVLAAILLLIVMDSYGQTYISPNPGLFGIQYNRAVFDSTFYFPTGCGVPTDSTYLHDKIGTKKAAFYFDTCGHNSYAWDPKLKAWIQSSGKTDSTVYTTHSYLNTKLSGYITRAHDTTIFATYHQTIFVTPFQITDINNVKVFRNGVDVDIGSYMSQEVIIAQCDAGDKIKIIQLINQ